MQIRAVFDGRIALKMCTKQATTTDQKFYENKRQMNKTDYFDASVFTASLSTVYFTSDLPFKNALKLCIQLGTRTDRISYNIVNDMRQY